MFKVEVVIRKERVVSEDLNKIKSLIEKYRELETDSRIILDFPKDWVGLRDGSIIEMLRIFNEAMFVGIAFFTPNGNLMVRDFEGNEVDKFEVVLEGKKVFKYVKKRLLIINELEKDKVFKIEGYLLDLRYSVPIRKVLDCYIDVKEVGFDWVRVVRGKSFELR